MRQTGIEARVAGLAAARLPERFTMTGPDTITYEETYSDPVIFTAPRTARLERQRNSKYRIFEYACHEGDVQVRGSITSSRAQRVKAAQEHKS